MDISYKGYAHIHAMDFESVYDMYDELYKVNDNPTVWRYMDFRKLELLFEQQALFFAKPSEFIDPLEGSYSKWDVDSMNESLSGAPLVTREYMKKVQEFSGISCWHMNEYESAGMWDLYLSSVDGVAIKSDFESLMRSLENKWYRIFAGKVQYIDYKNDMTSRNIYDTLFFKRKSFEHEKELRLMVVASRYFEQYLERKFDREGIPIEDWEEKMKEIEEESYEFFSNAGQLVQCNINKLIQKIYVSPKSSPEFVEKVKQLVENNGFNRNIVTQSDLYNDYIY